MSASPHFTGSIWFVTLVAVLVALGTQVLIGVLPVTIFDWIDNENRSGVVVLVAGETSFWRGDSLIRMLSFGFGAMIACLLVNSQSWNLVAALVLTSIVTTAFAQFPTPASFSQLLLWAASAPIATFIVSTLFRTWKGAA